MDVFDLRKRLVEDYARYTRSFIKIADPRISARVESDLNAGAFWPEPLLQLNPTFLPGGTIDDLVGEKTIHPECAKVFRIDKSDTDHTGKQLLLHTHQREASHCAPKAGLRSSLTDVNYFSRTGILIVADHQPVLPVDILGAYVLVPIPGAGGA